MKLTLENYREATKDIDFKKLPEAAQEAHKEFGPFAELYDQDKDIKEMLDNHFKIVEPYLKDASKSPRAGKKKTAKQVAKKRVIKPKKAIKKKAAKTNAGGKTPKKAKRKPIEVDLMPLEIRMIRRYINFHGKKVTEKQVSLLYKAIQKAATEKTIRKTSKYADEIRQIGNDLAKTYKEMGSSCTFEVPGPTYSKLKKVAGDYGITPAITLIKRFIALYGNITVAKAGRLLNSIKNAKKSGKVSKTDKAYDKVDQVQKHLESYLESDKLLVTDVELNGLKGFAGLGK